MSQPEKYDLVVLGSGEGGKFIAWSLGSQGKRSAVVERPYVGGSYPNIACLPSKNVIQSAKMVVSPHPIKSGSKKTSDPVMSFRLQSCIVM